MQYAKTSRGLTKKPTCGKWAFTKELSCVCENCICGEISLKTQ